MLSVGDWTGSESNVGALMITYTILWGSEKKFSIVYSIPQHPISIITAPILYCGFGAFESLSPRSGA